MEYNQKAILRALIYSSLFHYPLTQEQLWHYAISDRKLSKKTFLQRIKTTPQIASFKEYFFLKNDKQFVPSRIHRQECASRKFAVALQTAHILRYIPFICCIAVTGSLAMKNTKEEDDIDLFIITDNQTLWLTRLCIFVILALLHRRRKKYAVNVSDKICVNLFLETSQLSIDTSMQNIYTAHEVVQIDPLYNKGNTYEKFVSANNWVTEYMPNCLENMRNDYINAKENTTHIFLSFCNVLAKKLQLWYMTEKHSSEIITDSAVAFYTSETQKKVLKSYAKKVKQYGV